MKLALGLTLPILLLCLAPSLGQFLDRPNLIELYNALGGENWNNNTNWLTPADHCTWNGVICFNAGGFMVVVGLNLPLNNMKGILPPRLFEKFPFLVGVNFGSNVISGSIDDSICTNTQYLKFVELSLNILEGPIPDCIQKNAAMEIFSVRYNRLSGPFPGSFGNLKNLTILDISENRLEGPIPLNFCNVNKTLEYLLAVDNLLNGSIPECFGSFEEIVYFYLDSNRFSGTLPESVIRVNSTETFSASGNNIQGEIPDVFHENQQLKVFWIGNNNITGKLPASLSKCRRFMEFKADNNHLEGEIPESWSDFVRATAVIVPGNKLTGSIPEMSTLLFLNVRQNNMSGTVEVLTKMPLLQFLDLSYNNFSGTVPANLISNSSHLAHISLNNNDFSGNLFGLQVNKLAPVNYIDVSHNRFTGQMDIAFLPQLTSFKVNNNNMQGYIHAFAGSQVLKEMDYSNNHFIGPIPNIIGINVDLEIFKVDNNRLVGGIPEGMVDIKTLRTFTASGNLLEATDISVFASIPALEIIDISNNRINATLPETIGNLVNLQYFDASNNMMSGKIPEGLYTIPSLSTLNLANNSFEGTFSSLGGSAVLIDLSNNKFEGDVDWIASLTAIQTLNIRNNRFIGGVQDMSPNKQCSYLDLSNNQLSGEFPSISQLIKLVYLNTSHNSFSGHAPELDGSRTLEVLDLSNNLLSDASGLAFLPALHTCSLESNSFECPVTWQAYRDCEARCQVTPGGSATIRLRVEGNLDSFDSEKFKNQISTVGNFTQSRLKILGLSSGSVIADLEIAPPASDAINEGSAARVVEILTRLATQNKARYQEVGLDVLSASPIPQSTDSGQLSKGAIAGIVIAVVFVFAVLITIMIFLFIRGKRTVVTNQFAMIDVSTINLGAAKKSIIPYNELSEMNQIGAGAFGIVYRARWRGLDVAVKQIRAEYVTEEQLKDFLQEVAILQGLRAHPNVVLFMAVTFPPEPLSMITELCEGGSLYHYLRSHPVDLEQKKKFIGGIALGMLHLHSEKIVHRDLAVRNILLTKHLEPKVADFGLSREQSTSDSTSVTSSAVGPLKWMSPEAIQNRQYSTKSDSFSFGVCVWEILTIADPFPEHTPLEAAFMVVVEDKRLIIPSDADPTLASIMTACWDRNPDARPDMAQIIAALGPTKTIDTSPSRQEYKEGSTFYAALTEVPSNKTSAKSSSIMEMKDMEAGEREQNYGNFEM